MVRSRRLELPRPFGHQHLKLARLPFRHDRTSEMPDPPSGEGLPSTGPGGYQIGPVVASAPAPLRMAWNNKPLDDLEWTVREGRSDYAATLAEMEARADAIRAGTAPEAVWLVEHDPVYTAGTSARPEDLRDPRFPVFAAGRGGQYTYHGPGQRVAYAMLDLKARGGDVREYVRRLEEWMIRTLARFNVKGERREGRVGIWVDRGPDGRAPGGQGQLREDKIGAIGVRVKRWVAFHGISLNVDCDLAHFTGIVPCGISTPAYGVTSLADLGLLVSMAEVDMALEAEFEAVFG